MKKLVTILLVMAMVMVSANFATAGVFKKGDKAEEVVLRKGLCFQSFLFLA